MNKNRTLRRLLASAVLVQSMSSVALASIVVEPGETATVGSGVTEIDALIKTTGRLTVDSGGKIINATIQSDKVANTIRLIGVSLNHNTPFAPNFHHQ